MHSFKLTEKMLVIDQFEAIQTDLPRLPEHIQNRVSDEKSIIQKL